MKPGPPLVILGLDTGDPDAIAGWVAEGHLPTLAAVMERGSWARTGGPDLVCEYGVGLTLFSGVPRSVHGYYYFRQLVPGTYDLGTVEPPAAAAPPFWAHLPPGSRVLAVDVPDAALVPGLDGLQLSNWATHHGAKHGAVAEPPSLVREARRIFGPPRTIHSVHDPSPAEAAHVLAALLERVRRKGRLCRSLLDRGPFDLVALFFSETDAASHALWQYRPEAARDGDEPARLRLATALRDVYAAVDDELGQILDRAPGANIVVVSLYGCQDEYPTSTLVESFLRVLGYHVEAGAGDDGRPATGRKDALAAARRLLSADTRDRISRLLPARAQERLLAARLRSATDWGATTAFAIPSLFTSFVRVNLAGREPNGIVEPGTPYHELLDRLCEDFSLLTDGATGAAAVRRAVRTTDLYGGGPPRLLPDLFVEWEPGPRMLETVEHPRATLTQHPPAYCPDSQERLTGFVAAAGPSLATGGDVGVIDLVDLAPTFLQLLGEPGAASMPGAPCAELLA
jgi:predicted AlkP superfamily phosphohydrolase/phosphomutase